MTKPEKIAIICQGENAVAVRDNNHYRCLRCGAQIKGVK